MKNLNLPEFDFKTKTENGNTFIFDQFRQKYIKLTPEEFVRQSFARFLVEFKQYPANLMAIEYQIEINKNIRRCDIVVFNKKTEQKLIVECKAPNVKIDNKVFEQIFDYYFELKPDFLVVTNGVKHFCIKINKNKNTYEFINDIPDYKTLIG